MEAPKEIGMYVLELSTKISKLKKDKEELIEMLEKVKDLFVRITFPREIEMIAFANEIESIIQKHKA